MEVSNSCRTSTDVIGRGETEAKNKEHANLIDIDGGDENDSTVSSVLSLEDESVVDVSGQNLELSLLDNSNDSVKGLYFFRNVFNLIPKSIGGLGRLKKLKFFSNEIDLFPRELGNLVDLEYLQVKISPPGFGDGFSWDKLKGLKELELTKVPKRSSALTLLSEISGLKSLTRLSVCHFSIRYLPAEIGCLQSLEYLDLSFNKIKSLPNEISYLSSLMSLKVAHNRLIDLPPVFALLQNLESLDVSNNRLTTLDPLDLSLMPRLQILNLQYNKLRSYCCIPAWIQCNLRGNYEEMGVDTCSSMVEMDVYETPYENNTISVPHQSSHCNPLNMSTGVPSISRYFLARKSSKRWKRKQHYFQQRAMQERLNNSRKWKGEVPPGGLNLKMYVVEETGKQGMNVSQNTDKGSVDSICLDEEAEIGDSVITSEEEESSLKADLVSDNSRCVENQLTIEKNNKECCEIKASSPSSGDAAGTADYNSSSERKKPNHSSKRGRDKYLDNPKITVNATICDVLVDPESGNDDHNLEDVDGSFFGSSDEEPSEAYSMNKEMNKETDKIREKFHTVGYRDGITAGKEAAAQEGYNLGYKESVLAGYKFGIVRGVSSALAFLPDELKEKLIDEQETREKFQKLHNSVHDLSTEAAMKLFYGTLSTKQVEEKSGAEGPDYSLGSGSVSGSGFTDLGNYVTDLSSLLDKSPNIEVRFDT